MSTDIEKIAKTLDEAVTTAKATKQISLRTKVVEGLLLPQADLWFAYTQRSLWQLWDTQQSSPFRSTDYQPEAIYVIPTPPPLAPLWAGWNWRMNLEPMPWSTSPRSRAR